MRGVLVTAASAGFVSLAGCGGGGGGGDGGGGAGSTPVVYTGNSAPAVITATNSAVLTANVITAGDTVGSLSIAGAGSGGLGEVSHRLSRGVRSTVVRSLGEQRSGGVRLAPIDETIPCDSGGSFRVFGTVNDSTGTGTVSFTYNACRTGDATLDGSGSMTLHTSDLSDFTLSFIRLALSAPGTNVAIGGSLRSQTAGNTETITLDVVVVDNLSGEMLRSENLVYVDTYNDINVPSSYVEFVTGRIYDGVHGFVDVATNVQLVFDAIGQDFPGSGILQLTGANGARIRVMAASSNVVLLALDLDADSTFEAAATLNWTDLPGPAGSNLADSDGDGMHDSWELAKNLNPGLNDSSADADGDGASNLSEYLAGSNPRDPVSTPPVAGLSVAAGDSPDPVGAGTNLTYTFTVSNANAAAGTNVVLTVSLPAAVSFISATPPQGSCSGTGPVVCSLGGVGSFANVPVVVVVSPTGASPIMTATASVTATSFDPTSSDNTAASTTTVGTAIATVQAMIDAAADGDTVNLGPGIYVGGLRFNGKNIVLQGADPETTIIHGSNGTAVQMGPGGTISGFTITGARAFFGAGIDVRGVGSLITGNVFDGNVAEIGGYGAAIGGNNSSPIIQRNRFRNNSCDTQLFAGVVSFISGSSPQLYSNIFENNPCRGLNLNGTSFADTPVVINNTFVSNHTAIRGLRWPSPPHIYRNNIFLQNGIAFDVQEGLTVAPPTWENNLLSGNTRDYVGIDNQTGLNGNIAVDPLFVNQVGGDYHLLSGSQAIDAGSATGAPAVDFDGTARPQGAGIDIGAFERIP